MARKTKINKYYENTASREPEEQEVFLCDGMTGLLVMDADMPKEARNWLLSLLVEAE